jgi:hypothetical protein
MNKKSSAKPGQPANGDGQWIDFSGLYAKGLAHDKPGIPKEFVYKSFLAEIKRGQVSSKRPVLPALFEPRGSSGSTSAVPQLLGGTNKLNGPQGAFLKQVIGMQSAAYMTTPSPVVGSEEYAVELLELYWASLLRDVPFSQFGKSDLVLQAVNDLNKNIDYYRGPRDQKTKKVTPKLLFRGGLPSGKREKKAPSYFAGEEVGPYLSQLCVIPTQLGALSVNQKINTLASGKDFMVDPTEWYRVQQGMTPSESSMLDPVPRVMRCGRDLGAYTRVDELYQAYLIAFLVMANTWKLPPNPGLPYGKYKSQKAFGTLGGPDVTGVLGLVARAAINAVWYQKWVTNLRHRPEAGAGLVHLRKVSATPLPQAAAALSSKFLGILAPSLAKSAEKYRMPGKPDTFLLSQAFPEGSPTHPAYPTGHGTVAGACITVLKFFFNCTGKVEDYGKVMEPVEDGLSLRQYTGSDVDEMTVNGELHKLAHNVSFGHGILAGIHWRSDTDESIIFGESVAISILKELVCDYSEVISANIVKADGTKCKIAN